jgi:formylglycine-generating enzyme required for sulfatase activity
MTGNLTRGPSVGQGWRRRLLDQGLSAGLLELLGSCFEEQEDRPADAAVLAETLAALLKPEPVQPPEPPKEIENTIGMKLIPAGEFLMGSPESDKDASSVEKPQHQVRITQPFYLGIHQVTRGQFRRFVEAARYQAEAEKDGKGGYGWDASSKEWKQDPKFTWNSVGFEQTDDHPVVNVSWNDASAFCEWLSRQEGQKYRLPTEAEWEYACRAKTTRFSFGDDEKLLDQHGWYAGNSNNQTHPVGQKKENAFGLEDMHGNVWEWCCDGYESDYYQTSPASDPPGAEVAEYRVVRVGSWDNDPQVARSAYRRRFTPGTRYFALGIRVARVQSGR